MRLELAERLQCPRPHAPTPLVVMAEEARERELVRGRAGCVTCGFEMRIVEGRVDDATLFDDAPRTHAPSADEALDRLQALLGLAEPEGAVLLAGSYVAFDESLAARCGVSTVRLARGAPVVPFTDGTFRGAAIGAPLPPALMADVVRSLAVGARLVGSASLAVPAGVVELARDEREWVAERDRTSGVVGLTRRR